MANLITAADLADDANFNALPPARQDQLLTSVSRKVEAYCRREFTQASYVEYHDGNGGPCLFLRHRPVVSIASVVVNGWPLDNSGNPAWTLDPESGLLTRGNGLDSPAYALRWPYGTRNIVITLTAGYAPIPADIVEACRAELKYIGDTAKTSGLFQQERIGDYFYTLNQYTKAETAGGIGSQGSRALLAPYIQDDIT